MTGAHRQQSLRITRRDWLRASAAGTITAALIPAHAHAAGPYLQPQSSTYPRGFAFRQSEVLANTLDYAQWERAMRPLGGIVGKILQEERKDSVTARNLAYFHQFKIRFPNKMALLHLNGLARLPDFETGQWYPGWWLCKGALRTTRNTPKSSAIVEVDDLAGIVLETDAFGGAWQDILITRRGTDGKPDYAKFEYVRMTGFDPVTKKLVVERAQYGSRVRYWPAGSLVAPIVTMGPYYRGGNKLWYHNYAINAPRSPDGLSAVDAVVNGLAAHLQSGLAFLDGIQLDVFTLTRAVRQNIDADGDGVADSGMEGSADRFLEGMSELLSKLRFALGEDRLLVTDGGSLQRPDLGFVNGVEMEGTPSTSDPDFLGWSEAVETLRYYRRFASERSYNFGPFGTLTSANSFSYTMFKNKPVLGGARSFANFRLTLAASLIASAAITYFDDPLGPGSTSGLPPGEGSGTFNTNFSVWDELIGGDLGNAGWLGYPITSARYVLDPALDHFSGRGIILPQSFVGDVEHASYGTELTRATDSDGDPFLSLEKPGSRGAVKFDLPPVVSVSEDLTLTFQIWAEPTVENPERTPRFMTVSVIQAAGTAASQTIPVGPDWQSMTLSFRRLDLGPARIQISCEKTAGIYLRYIRCIDGPGLVAREFSNGAVFANPSDREARFNIASLFPGSSFRRLTATAEQDTVTNNGEAVGEELIVPPIDAIVVAKI